MPVIFLVEDDVSLRAMLRDCLMSSGYEVLEFTDGRGVVEMYQQQRPDLVITDIVMPEKEGLELILDLRRGDQNVKCIAMSEAGLDGETYLKIAQRFGVKHTLSKPFPVDEFLAAILSTLES